ncbi:hypothetical protein GX48_04037 [Paracoccidioides brasiliensis]|nr:hypothetical protein GX48_04037 [Paracoccidioides brasiliensis]
MTWTLGVEIVGPSARIELRHRTQGTNRRCISNADILHHAVAKNSQAKAQSQESYHHGVIPSQSRKFFPVDETSSNKGKPKSSALLGVVSSQCYRQPRFFAWTKKSDENASGNELSDAYSSSSQAHIRSGSPPLEQPQSRTLTSESHQEPSYAVRSLSPQIALGETRPDPFDALPSPPNDESQQLVDCWISKLTPWPGKNHFMKQSVYKEAMMHTMTFHVCVFTYTARYLASVSTKNNIQSSSYVSPAENMLNAYPGNSQYQGDGASTMAFTALSVQEARYGNKCKSIKYLDAALQILSRRR